MNTFTCTSTLRTLARTKRSRLRIMTRSEHPYKDAMSSRVSKRLTKHMIGQIAKKISGALISAAAYVRTFDDHVAFMETLWQRMTFRAIVCSRSRGDLQGHALRRNINTVTMPTCDVYYVILAKRCYTQKVYALHTLIYHILLVILMLLLWLCVDRYPYHFESPY